jgi:hypothetical protein
MTVLESTELSMNARITSNFYLRNNHREIIEDGIIQIMIGSSSYVDILQSTMSERQMFSI